MWPAGAAGRRRRCSGGRHGAAAAAARRMPGLVVFGRRWAIGSDDFVLPGAFELFVRLVW